MLRNTVNYAVFAGDYVELMLFCLIFGHLSENSAQYIKACQIYVINN